MENATLRAVRRAKRWIKKAESELAAEQRRQARTARKATARENSAELKALRDFVRGFVQAWGGEVERDEPINGGDAVDWISGAMLEARAALAYSEPFGADAGEI